jgi:hypothetical protein
MQQQLMILQSIIARCTTATRLKIIVFDPKRELYTYILGINLQVPVLLLDPTDRRGVAWDLAADITDPNLAKVDPTIRLIFERLTHLFLARPDVRFLPDDFRPETHVVLDEAAKAGKIARIDDLLLMGSAKGVFVTIAAQDVEATRQEYGQKIADSVLAQCGNTAVFTLESPETCEYCASLFGTHEVRERPITVHATSMQAALDMDPKDAYHPGELREHKTLLPSQFAELPLPQVTGHISGYYITGGLGAHYASYPFANLLLPPAAIPDLVPRDEADQEFPDSLSVAQRKRLGLPDAEGRRSPPAVPASAQSPAVQPSPTDSLRFIKRITGQ